MSAEREMIEQMLQWFSDEEHWTQGSLKRKGITGDVSSTCLLGALSYSATGAFSNAPWSAGKRITYLRVLNAVRAVIGEQYPERTHIVGNGAGYSIVRFNDHRATTVADVRAVLEKTRAQLQEEG